MNQGSKDKSMSSKVSGRLIDFDQAEIRHAQFNDEIYLFVSGENVGKGWTAMLAPVIQQNKLDYLTVEVLKVNDKEQDEESSCYRVSLPLSGIAGKKGVTLIGANETRTIDL